MDQRPIDRWRRGDSFPVAGEVGTVKESPPLGDSVWNMKFPMFRRQAWAAARLVLCAFVACAGPLVSRGARAGAQEPAPAQQAAPAPAVALLGPEDLRPLVAPIALYPDDLLA